MLTTMLMSSFLHLIVQRIHARTIIPKSWQKNLHLLAFRKKKQLNRSTAIERLMGFQ